MSKVQVRHPIQHLVRDRKVCLLNSDFCIVVPEGNFPKDFCPYRHYFHQEQFDLICCSEWPFTLDVSLKPDSSYSKNPIKRKCISWEPKGEGVPNLGGFDWEWEQIERHIWRGDHLASKSRPLSQAERGWSWIKQHTLTKSAFQSFARLMHYNALQGMILNKAPTDQYCIPCHSKTTDFQGCCNIPPLQFVTPK